MPLLQQAVCPCQNFAAGNHLLVAELKISAPASRTWARCWCVGCRGQGCKPRVLPPSLAVLALLGSKRASPRIGRLGGDGCGTELKPGSACDSKARKWKWKQWRRWYSESTERSQFHLWSLEWNWPPQGYTLNSAADARTKFGPQMPVQRLLSMDSHHSVETLKVYT